MSSVVRPKSQRIIVQLQIEIAFSLFAAEKAEPIRFVQEHFRLELDDVLLFRAAAIQLLAKFC